jgi:uncharacterized membrane protein
MKHILHNRHGFEFISNFFAISFFVSLVLSFFIAKLILNVYVLFTAAIVVAVVLGKLTHLNREQTVFPYYATAAAFIIGYVLGHRVGNGLLLIIVFVGAFLATRKCCELIE